MGAKSGTANVSHSTQIPRTCPLTLGDRVNFLHLIETNPTGRLGHVNVSQQRDTEKCD
jgi:hypothetical protein